MDDLYLQIDASKFQDVMEEFRKDLQKDLNESIKHLADMTFEKTLEFAEQGLKTTFSIYKDSLSSPYNKEAGVYVISLDQKAMWIEEGLPENFDMKPGLLKDAEVSKDGHKYAVVPFKHDKRPSQNVPKAQDLVNQVKKVLKQEGIPFRKIERNDNGSPRLGLLHKIDIDSAKPTAKASTPALQGLRVYQNAVKDSNGNVKKDKDGNAMATKGIYTFRTVTDGPKGSDKFFHPGLDAKKFMDKALEWAEQTFEREILPELLKKWGSK